MTCTHSWETCPVHSLPGGELPDMKTVLVCVYGDVETKAGTLFGEQDAEAVMDRVWKRLGGEDERGE